MNQLDIPLPADFARARALATAVLRLQAEAVGQDTFQSAMSVLAAGLAAEGGFDRVSLGLVENGSSRVAAMSDGLPPEDDTAQMREIAAAMDEALDQGVTVSFPAAARAASREVSLAHRTLARRVGACFTVPLVAGGRPLGAVTFERRADLLDAEEIDAFEHAVCLLGPIVHLMSRDALPWYARLVESARRRLARAFAPEKRLARGGLAAALLVLLALLFVPVDRHIAGRARIEGIVQRVLVAPTEGFINSAQARPGDRVRTGDVLLELADKDLQLERRKWGSQLTQHENAYAGAASRADRGLAAIHLARAAEARAQLELVDAQLERSRVEAPFDGIVIQGDLSQSIGAPVRQGDPLMTIARTDGYRVIVEVDERDVRPLRAGQRGSIALSALPWDALPIEVTRITPVATQVEGANVFDVEAALIGEPPEVRPGLRGVAKITAGTQPLIIGWTRRAIDWARLTLWGWW